jgi:flagellar biosynthetic protein FliQ
MSHLLIVDLVKQAVLMVLLLSGPMLMVALGVGLVVSIVQAVTSIQEQTLSFVPKLLAVAGVFLVALPWMIQQMAKYTVELLRSIPTLIQ